MRFSPPKKPLSTAFLSPGSSFNGDRRQSGRCGHRTAPPYLEPEDVIIDGGNSHFEDTARRGAALAEQGIQYLGWGSPAGSWGRCTALRMMVGGNYEGWIRCREILQSIAAQVDGEPCCEYVGQAGAGHYVKMVHNGIEYAILQLLG